MAMNTPPEAVLGGRLSAHVDSDVHGPRPRHARSILQLRSHSGLARNEEESVAAARAPALCTPRVNQCKKLLASHCLELRMQFSVLRTFVNPSNV